jgi:peptide/nickel transport system substrate-binding protein
VKTKLFVSIFIGIVIVATLLGSCGTKEPLAEITSTVPSTPPKEGAPKYGGSITVAPATITEQFDPASAGSAMDSIMHFNVYETLGAADWTKGPAGTGEINFTESIAGKWFVPSLAASWTIESPTKFIFNLRQGVRFQNKPPVNGREVTADDWVYSMTRTGTIGSLIRFRFPPEKVYAQGKYTVVVEFTVPKYDALKFLNYMFYVYPPEIVGADNTIDWKNSCGTGPFILTDYSSATSSTLLKNPDYWGFDPLRPSNKLPYLDKITVVYIADEATRLAGLRTGQIDRLGEVSPADAETMAKTNPQILQGVGPGSLHAIYVRNDLKPFSDIRVRRALFMALDLQGMQKNYFKGQANLPADPILPPADWYTPLNELQPDLAELFSYNPVKAKQLLADAGYPQGFSTTLLVDTASGIKEEAVLIKNYWDAIGVKTEIIIPAGSAVYDSMALARDFQATIMSTSASPDGIMRGRWIKNSATNYFWGLDANGKSTWSDDEVTKLQDQITAEVDANKRIALMKQLNLMLMGKILDIPMPCPYSYTLWQPRLQGYYGVAGMGQTFSVQGMWRYAWVNDGK